MRSRSGAWQAVLARWLLIVTLIGGLGLTGSGPASTASAQANPAFAPPPGDAASSADGAAASAPTRLAPARALTDSGAVTLDPPSATCTPEQAEASFGANDHLVMAYYYYWYDQASLEDPALTLHPPGDPPLDWHDVAWHERQLMDMATAGIDVALAVYWGTGIPWATQGLDKMVEARERLLAQGLRPPAIGLFFDTNLYATILPERPELSNLTTDEGMETLADQVSGFFRHVPRCHRARVDGRPLVFFWRSDTEDGDHFTFDDDLLSNLNEEIGKLHNERLHFVLEQSWMASAREANVDLGATDYYQWGAALNGPRFLGRTVAVGPGYDDRRIEGRPGYTRERDSGATYSRDLRAAVMSGQPWLLLETWNELWEGTAIAETQENGRTYLGITARYAALFHRLTNERARDGWADLGSGESVYLRRLADAPVEQGTPMREAGRDGARPFPEDDGTGYFHFAVDRRLGISDDQPVTVQVEYFDEGEGSFDLEYDSLDPTAPEEGAYKTSEPVFYQNTQTWRVARFTLADAGFRGRQYDGIGDFRIHDMPGPDGQLHGFGRVRVTAVSGLRPIALRPESLTLVTPSATPTATLTWSELEAATAYVVDVQPFDAATPIARELTDADRQFCRGAVSFASGASMRGVAEQSSCQIELPAGATEDLYRWRVQGIGANGLTVGEPSDWAYLAVTGN
jgi:hypothetical protein